MLGAFTKLPPERRAEILDVAATVIARHGYHHATVADICEAVSISNGALYKYFRNKESLFIAILDYGLHLMVTELYQKYVNPADSLADSVKNLLGGMRKFAEDYRQYVSLYVEIGSCSMNSYARHVSERIEREGRDFFVGLVEGAKGRGEVDPGTRSDLLAYCIDSFITLYAYSLVSEHHSRRFDAFFGINGPLAEEEKIDIVVKTVTMLVDKTVVVSA